MIKIIRNIALVSVLISAVVWIVALSFVMVTHPEWTARQAAIETAWFVVPIAIAGIVLFVADKRLKRQPNQP